MGFWSASAGFDHADQRQSLDIKTNNLDVSFSYCAVDIRRPWLDASLLNLGNWFLMGDYKKGCISNGTMGQELSDTDTELVFLPSVVTSLVLIKDLSIRWDNWQDDWNSNSSTTSASASVGWGPFSVNGHYSHHDERTDFQADASGESLRVHGIQLLGYVSMINPLCPKVDSSQFLTQPR